MFVKEIHVKYILEIKVISTSEFSFTDKDAEFQLYIM